jgi:hypothetical protein
LLSTFESLPLRVGSRGGVVEYLSQACAVKKIMAKIKAKTVLNLVTPKAVALV